MLELLAHCSEAYTGRCIMSSLDILRAPLLQAARYSDSRLLPGRPSKAFESLIIHSYPNRTSSTFEHPVVVGGRGNLTLYTSERWKYCRNSSTNRQHGATIFQPNGIAQENTADKLARDAWSGIGLSRSSPNSNSDFCLQPQERE